MTQQDRDRLVTLKKCKKKLITQGQAAGELGVTERQVRRLLKKLGEERDRAAIHGLRGRSSNRRMSVERRQEIVEILSADVYHGFGPTLASEYLRDKHGIEVGRECLRKLMTGAELWRARPRKIGKVHCWRPRRSRFGELVQWDTSEHDWLEGRGEKIYLIHMIDDATSRLWARFVRHDSTEENLGMLRTWLELHGRPLAFYTDKASLFYVAPKTTSQHRLREIDGNTSAVTQIGRALRELDVVWIPAHSAQAKGRVERSFCTAQDRLVKGLRVAGASTLEMANKYLQHEFVPWWDQTLTVCPGSADNAHRQLGPEHNLNAALSRVFQRKVANDYTVRWKGGIYQIQRRHVVPGLRGAGVRVERRADGSLAFAYQGNYLDFALCGVPEKYPESQPMAAPPAPAPKRTQAERTAAWRKFSLRPRGSLNRS